MLEREVVERGGVGELQVGEVPVDDLTVARGQVDVGRRVTVKLLKEFYFSDSDQGVSSSPYHRISLTQTSIQSPPSNDRLKEKEKSSL